MFHAIYVGSTSACFELENRSAYYAPEAWQVQLDGMTVREGRENVFSLFGLEPGRSYAVTLRMGAEERAIKITTRQESCAVSVKDFGARGDGVSVDTVALQWAVMLLPEDGRLVFPAGTYLTGPIMLKSHMTLELTEGAVLMGLTDKAAYPVIPAGTMDLDSGDDVWFGTFEGQARRMYASLLTAEYAEDIRIVGPGHVDGDARHGDWWQTFQQDPVARPRLLFFSNCNNVTVHGIDVSNSPSWHVHPYKSWSMAFYDVSVSAPKDSPNTDALDPERELRWGRHRWLPLLGGGRLSHQQVRQAGRAARGPLARDTAYHPKLPDVLWSRGDRTGQRDFRRRQSAVGQSVPVSADRPGTSHQDPQGSRQELRHRRHRLRQHPHGGGADPHRDEHVVPLRGS